MFYHLMLCQLEQHHLQITDKKLYITAVTLSFQENVKLLKQLYSGFKRTHNYINRKYQWRDKTNDSIT